MGQTFAVRRTFDEAVDELPVIFIGFCIFKGF